MPSNTSIAENLKKYFYSGIGFASHASELFQRSVDEYVKAGRVSESDGKKIVSDLTRKLEDRRSGLEDKYNEAVHKFIALSASEIAGLQKKVEKLEGQLKAKGTFGGSAPRVAAKPAGSSVAKKVVKAVKKVAKKAAPAKKK